MLFDSGGLSTTWTDEASSDADPTNENRIQTELAGGSAGDDVVVLEFPGRHNVGNNLRFRDGHAKFWGNLPAGYSTVAAYVAAYR
jgi:hypothetical protein